MVMAAGVAQVVLRGSTGQASSPALSTRLKVPCDVCARVRHDTTPMNVIKTRAMAERIDLLHSRRPRTREKGDSSANERLDAACGAEQGAGLSTADREAALS
jgi:hypothetical protein